MSLILLQKTIADAALTAIFNYKDHPRILAIQGYCEKKTFRFSNVNIEEIKKDILKLDKNKASLHSDIPIKIIKENLDIFTDFLCTNINSSFKSSSFLSCLKMTDVTPLNKKGTKGLKENYTDQLVFFQYSRMYLKGLCLLKCLAFLLTFCQNNNMASGTAIVHNNVF